MSAAFDFKSYLSQLFDIPDANIQIQHLTGGLTNFTVRATFIGHIASLSNSTRTFPSVIAKHAPPYIASLGPTQALSTKRQVIEATALGLFSLNDGNGDTKILSSVLRRHPDIRIPEVVHHDEKNSLLIMSDLGKLPTLSEYLKVQSGPVNFAVILGDFLADLYTSTRDTVGEVAHLFENQETSASIGELIGSLPEKLLKSHGVPDAEALGKAIRNDLSNKAEGEQCFGMADLWPGSVLIGSNFLGLVDWEYAGISSAGAELGMLTAHLHIPLQSPILRVAHSQAVRNFVTDLLSAFSERFPARTDAFTRSALLSHGRELINALEFQPGELEGETHRKNLLETGERCIRAAVCDDPHRRSALLTQEERTLLRNLL
ncbi:hypothetical protein M422DRAFT_780461 [Sphaerobolus stellatus SS14]|uniref:Aminoglycoside phosphotransferase domain-containing protein n=1 Tax=Sphaerobolus stellatus (strain SS14) TaxID=990650 RepID=A0A0C9V1T4_SPHS4|nr:hypothetical protein M422DRAFT_780461 [Sphaerobolus stellatus SS14]